MIWIVDDERADPVWGPDATTVRLVLAAPSSDLDLDEPPLRRSERRFLALLATSAVHGADQALERVSDLEQDALGATILGYTVGRNVLGTATISLIPNLGPAMEWEAGTHMYRVLGWTNIDLDFVAADADSNLVDWLAARIPTSLLPSTILVRCGLAGLIGAAFEHDLEYDRYIARQAKKEARRRMPPPG